ncbi:MAG: sigma-70 family RNA polymerase sigma factor [Acidobacteria bacterium]|nr:sigma-70 family RNA polymerase sigma factor [Acidobacteriota bacterium]
MTSSSNFLILHRCAASGPVGSSTAGQDLVDSICWESLIQAYGRLLRGSIRGAFLRRGVPFTEADLEEAQQEVYFRLLDQDRRRLHQFRGSHESQARSFLRRVASSVVFDMVRRGTALKRGGEMLEDIVHGDTRSGESTFLLYTSTPEVEILSREQFRRIVRRCRRIASRSSHGRRNLRILHLALVEGRTSREIARRLGSTLSTSTIDSILHRIRRDLASEGLRLPARKL